jgi:hypothetical protein
VKPGLGLRKQGLGMGRSALVVVALMNCVAGAQDISLGGARAEAHKGHVVLVSDAVQVLAGKPEAVELRFRVDPGFHINSHTPKDDLLIPTVLTLDPARDVKVSGETYQPGASFRLNVGSGGAQGETLDVYQGEFRVSVRMVAPKGASTLIGSLRYQACDNTACFPPKTLPVMVAVTGQ